MNVQPRNLVARAWSRIVQGVSYLSPHRASEIDTELRGLLTADEFRLVARLSNADRAHLLSVHRQLVRLGCEDSDLLKAGLLHDVGKVEGDVRVGLTQRSMAVLLNAMAPHWFDRMITPNGGRWRGAFVLVREHPSVGARYARDAGCTERVCWLIEHHHDVSAMGDVGLQLLQQADEGRTG